MNKYLAIAALVLAANMGGAEGFGMPPEHRCAGQQWEAELIKRKSDYVLHNMTLNWERVQLPSQRAVTRARAREFFKKLVYSMPVYWLWEASRAAFMPKRIKKRIRALEDCILLEAGYGIPK